MRIKSTQMIVNEMGKIIMGTGRMRILASIDRTRSINKTAKELNMAYKTVWSKIKATEKNFGRPVIFSDRKKGSELTPEGRWLLEKYQELKQRCIETDDAVFEELFGDGGANR